MEVKALFLLLAVGLVSSAMVLQEGEVKQEENPGVQEEQLLEERLLSVGLENRQSEKSQAKCNCGIYPCCVYVGGAWGCCPNINGVCCNGFRCCPSGYRCLGTDYCVRSKSLYPFIVD